MDWSKAKIFEKDSEKDSEIISTDTPVNLLCVIFPENSVTEETYYYEFNVEYDRRETSFVYIPYKNHGEAKNRLIELIDLLIYLSKEEEAKNANDPFAK